MDRHTIRYIVEHKMMPQWFFEDQGQFIAALVENKTIIYDVIDGMFREENLQNPYRAEQFFVEPAKLTDDIYMVKITYPEPEEEPLCYCSYLFFTMDFGKAGFYCIEKGNDLGENAPFACSWTKDGTHHNHGHCVFEENEDFLKCFRSFVESEYGPLKRDDPD